MGDVVGHYQAYRAGHRHRLLCHCCPRRGRCFHVRGSWRARLPHRRHPDRTARRELIDGLRTGEVQVLCSCEVISEGTDVPSVGGAILCRPTNSLSLFLRQQVGRCLRPAVGKKKRSFSTTPATFVATGFRKMCSFWSLDGAKVRQQDEKRRDAPWVTVCPECFAAIPGGGCSTLPLLRGTYRKRRSRKDASAREHCARSESSRTHDTNKSKRRKSNAAAISSRKLERCQELQAIAKERGYSPGWAYHIFRSRNERGRFL